VDEYLYKAGMAIGDERQQHLRTVERIRKRQQKGINYRVGTLIQVDGEWTKVQFTNEAEVMPINCVAVVEKPRATKQLEIAC